MSTRQKRRFIAGAVCPKCQSLDSIMLYMENNVEKISCVKCDYTEVQTEQQVQEQTRQNESVIGLFKPE